MLKIKDKNNNLLIEQTFFADEFIWYVYGNVEITKEENELFYEELNKIMNSQYIFQLNTISSKTNNKIIWLSDQYCDIENEESLNKINRLIIEKKNDKFIIYVENPFLNNMNIKKEFYVISFSPLGNGFYSKNFKTGSTFQDDIIFMYHNLSNNKTRVLK